MKLKSFGCSFLYGSDLSDCPHGINKQHPGPSALTWPALLAKKLGLEYECYAWPGTGNLKILERILCQSTDIEASVFVVSWTWIDRLDYIYEHKHPWTNWSWTSIMPGDLGYFANHYYKNYHCQAKDQTLNLVLIKCAIDTLRDKGIPFIMTYMDDLILAPSIGDHAALMDLQESIRQNCQTFGGKSFLQWSIDNDFDISPKSHPLEFAHVKACEYVLDNWSLPMRKD